MPKAWSVIKQQKGFSVIEALLAAVVFGFLVTGLIGALVYGRASSASSGDRIRAVYLAEEGIEATRNVADASYTNLVDGTYGLTQVGSQWKVSGTSDTTDIYTRKATIATVGTNRKTITCTVTWPEASGATGSVTLTTQLVNWTAPIKQWSNAILAGSTTSTGTSSASDTDTIGNFAYTVLNATSNNFVITDVSNFAVPTNVSTVTLAGTPTNIFVSGNYAYITNTGDTAELQVVDISNPAAPVLKASVNMTGTGDGLGVYVSGNYAYVVRTADSSAGANELTIINVATPTAPVVVGGYNNNVQMNDIYVSGNYAYIAQNNFSNPMIVVNVTNPAAPTLTATYSPFLNFSNSTAINGFGNTVLLSLGSTLDAVNVTNPAAPIRLGTFTADGTVNDIGVDITNNFAFLATSGFVNLNAELEVVNVSNPAAISLTKKVTFGGLLNVLQGLSYDSSLDIVVGDSNIQSQKIVTFTRN